MAIQTYYTAEDFKSLALEVRRASWAVAAFFAWLAQKQEDYSLLAISVTGWLLLQLVAGIIISFKPEEQP